MKQLLVTVFLVTIHALSHAQVSVSNMAPDISLPDANGAIIKLSSLKGKIVLLDFWASWCGPCRQSNKHNLPLYKKYKDKGFEVYSVSIDADKQAWVKAVKQDNIQWLHVIDTQAANGNQLTQTWDLKYIPSTFLIDKDGKVVAVGPEKEELESLLKRLL